jgi:hypothetical protein
MPYSNHPRLKRLVQIVRAAAYSMFAGAGATILYVGEPPFPWRYVVMAGFMMVGGALCFLGQLLDRWAGELLGLPLVATSMSVFAVLTVRDAGWNPITAPSVLMLGAVGVMFFMRWVDQFMLARAARHMALHHQNPPNNA